MKIAITFQSRNNINLKKIISTHKTAGRAFDALAEIAMGDEDNYIIGTPRYSAPDGIYRIQYASNEELKRGWIVRTALITDGKKF